DPALELAAPAAERIEELLGREHELAELLPVVDEALGGAGGLLLVGGEPGIGKSRLAEALAARARDREARVLVGRCWEAGGAPAYWPWVQALRGQVGDLLELRDLLPADAPDDGSEGARFGRFEAVGSALSQAAPVAVFLDDVHAADSPSLLLLRFLTAQLAGSQVLICCCYRDTEASRDLTVTLADLGRDPVTHRVALSGLDERATEHLLEEAMGSAPAAELLSKVQDGTRGNPLFVAELGRLLATGDWRDGRLPIPEGVREAIGHRLER